LPDLDVEFIGPDAANPDLLTTMPIHSRNGREVDGAAHGLIGGAARSKPALLTDRPIVPKTISMSISAPMISPTNEVPATPALASMARRQSEPIDSQYQNRFWALFFLGAVVTYIVVAIIGAKSSSFSSWSEVFSGHEGATLAICIGTTLAWTSLW
jgi:hypothetical protein